MIDNILCQTWGSCQAFGGRDKRTALGAFYGDLNCQFISPDDMLLLCQVGEAADGEPTVNRLEVRRRSECLAIRTYVEALGGFRDVACRKSSDRNIKIAIKPEADSGGSYRRIRFLIYDADHPNTREAAYARVYALPKPQSIDRVAVVLRPCDGYGEDYRPSSLPVGIDNFRACSTGEMPEILKPNFEWHGEEHGHSQGRIVSRHYESYKLNVLANLKQWKEKV